MMLLDANVLIGAFRPEMPDHVMIKSWLDGLIVHQRQFGIVDGLLCGFVRIVTQKPFNPITPVGTAMAFAASLRAAQSFRLVLPSPSQWAIFDSICQRTKSHGKAAQDAYWASFALDLDCEFITFGGGFVRIPGLRWRSPFDAHARTNPR